MRTLKFAATFLVTCGLILSAGTAFAVPFSLEEQGRLLKSDGTPVTGNVSLTFTIYDAKTGGAILWQGQTSATADASGFYSVTLGDSNNPIDTSVLKGGSVWLGVKVNGGQELSPRTSLNSVPYAVIAGRANSVADGSITTSSLAPNFSVSAGQVAGVSWGNIINIPPDIADGDNDTLAALSCTTGQVAQFNGTKWACAKMPTYDGHTFATSNQACGSGKVVTGINATGKVTCATDQNSGGTVTGVNAGTGITVGGAATKPTVSAKFGSAAGTVCQGNDPRLSDARPPKSGSNDYIQNQASKNQNASLRISGNALVAGKVGIGTTTPTESLDLGGGNMAGHITDRVCPRSYYLLDGYCLPKKLLYTPRSTCSRGTPLNGVCQEMPSCARDTAANAVADCKSLGGRLCTPAELDRVDGTGCGFDYGKSWVQFAGSTAALDNSYTGIGLCQRTSLILSNAGAKIDEANANDDIAGCQAITSYAWVNQDGTGIKAGVHCCF